MGQALSANDLILEERAVTGNLLFDTLTAPARRAIINSMSPLSVPPGTAIIKQGDTDAKRFYVLASGQATVHVANADTGASTQVATYAPARRAA
jgi:cGMP-dependent protein kinase